MSSIISTLNSLGWTSTVPNQVTCELLQYLRTTDATKLVVLDIGAALGVGTLPMLEAGATVIANDLEPRHIKALKESAAKRQPEGRLQTVLGRFPEELDFRELDLVHCSNVLHFLTGGQISIGARRIHDWLRPGGMVFIQVGTIYAGHVRRLYPLFEERKREGARWPGETCHAKDLVAAECAADTPAYMNYLDGPPLVETFEACGFQTEKAWYYTRHGLPAVCRNDGRENFGYIGRRLDGMNDWQDY